MKNILLKRVGTLDMKFEGELLGSYWIFPLGKCYLYRTKGGQYVQHTIEWILFSKFTTTYVYKAQVEMICNDYTTDSFRRFLKKIGFVIEPVKID